MTFAASYINITCELLWAVTTWTCDETLYKWTD